MSDPDELLMDELRAVAKARTEPVPTAVAAAARAAYTWRTVDAELALLAYDSATDDRELMGVRGDGPRLLSFSAMQVSLDVEVSETPRGRSLRGEAAPAPQELQLQRSAGGAPVDVAVDAAGRFLVEQVDAGPVRFRFLVQSSSGSRILSTEWVSI